MKNIIYAILVLFIIGISGCGNKDEKTGVTTKTTGQKTEDTKTRDTSSNNKEVSSNKLPADLPSDMPMYKDFKILSDTKGGTGPIVTYETGGKAQEVGDFYKSELQKNGYKADSFNDKMVNKDGGILTYTKEGKEYTISYRYNETKGKTTVTIQSRSLNN